MLHIKPRHEYKHHINLSDMMQLKSRMTPLLKHDPYCDENGTYIIKTLYFDNYADKVLNEKVSGISYREKFRIRYYNNDTSFIRLEKKSKRDGLCYKESANLTQEECSKIINGDFSFLLDNDSQLLKEFYTKMHYQLLRPKCIVAYTRESFVFPAGNVRITLDSNISGSSNVKEFFNPDLAFTKLFNHTILEVKWDEYLPRFLQDLVQMKNGRKPSAFSKYAAVRFI